MPKDDLSTAAWAAAGRRTKEMMNSLFMGSALLPVFPRVYSMPVDEHYDSFKTNFDRPTGCMIFTTKYLIESGSFSRVMRLPFGYYTSEILLNASFIWVSPKIYFRVS